MHISRRSSRRSYRPSDSPPAPRTTQSPRPRRPARNRPRVNQKTDTRGQTDTSRSQTGTIPVSLSSSSSVCNSPRRAKIDTSRLLRKRRSSGIGNTSAPLRCPLRLCFFSFLSSSSSLFSSFSCAFGTRRTFFLRLFLLRLRESSQLFPSFPSPVSRARG